MVEPEHTTGTGRAGLSSPPSPSQRVSSLDGLRGWAALSVVVFHLTWETFGRVLPAFRSFPVAFVAHGDFAVALFLMVSGYVLTVSGWRNRDKSGVRRSMLKRYVRLTIPIFVSVLIFWAVLALGWSMARPASEIVQRPDWLGRFGPLDSSFFSATWYGLVDVYLTIGPGTFGPFLWTMKIELWWSLAVLAVCWFELPRGWAYVPLAGIYLLLLTAQAAPTRLAACYAGGAVVALAVRDGLIRSGPPGRAENWVATITAAVALLAAALAQLTRAPGYLIVPIAFVGFVAVLRSATLARALSSPLSQWLGRLSFPLYLIQIVIIVTVTSRLIVWSAQTNSLTQWTAGGIVLVSLAACLIAARALMPVERLALALAARLGRLVRTRPAETPTR